MARAAPTLRVGISGCNGLRRLAGCLTATNDAECADAARRRKDDRDMKTKERRSHPEVMTTFEYLDEQLYQMALKGGYQKEFNLTKAFLPVLEPFATPIDFMHAVRQETQLRDNMVEALEKLWQEDYDLRPASGVVLMLAQWVRAPNAKADFWFEYFDELGKGTASKRD